MRSREERREDRQERREERQQRRAEGRGLVDGIGNFIDGVQDFAGDVVGGIATAALDATGAGMVMDAFVPGASDAIAGFAEGIITAPLDMPLDFVQTALGPAFGGDGGVPAPPAMPQGPATPYGPVTPGLVETGATAVYQNNPTDANYQAMLGAMQTNMQYQLGPENVPPPSYFPIPPPQAPNTTPLSQQEMDDLCAGMFDASTGSSGGCCAPCASGASGSSPGGSVPPPSGMSQQQADDLCAGMFGPGGPPPIGYPAPPEGSSHHVSPARRCYLLRQQAKAWLRDNGCPSRVIPYDYSSRPPRKRSYGGRC